MKEKSNFNIINRKIVFKLILLLLAFIPNALFSQQSYDIKFKIRDIYADEIVIKSYFGKDIIIIDTLKIKEDSSFYLKKDNINQGIGIITVGRFDIFTFLFDKSNKFAIEMDSDWNYVVNGCMDNDLYFEFQKANTKMRRLDKSIRKEMQENKQANRDSLESLFIKESKIFIEFQNSFYENYPNHIMSKLQTSFEDIKVPEEYKNGNAIDTTKIKEFIYYYKTHYWDNFDFSDQRLLGTPNFFKKLKTYMSEITFQKGDSIGESIKDLIVLANKNNGYIYSKYIVDYYLKSYRNVPFSYSEEKFVGIVDKVIDYQITPWLPISGIDILKMEADKLRPLLPNQKFKNITEKDFEGKTHSLYDLKNKYTIVYFFSAECESCKINLEVLEKFYNDFKNVYDVEVFSIDLDHNMEASLKFRKAHPFNWIVLKTTSEELESKYNLNIEMTPDIYILDKDKKIINHTPSYNQIEETIKRIEEKQ